MAADAVEISSGSPSEYGPEVTVRFFPEYSLQHPLWFWFGHPDLADLQLPADLADRLRRWSAYWDRTFDWEDGWPDGAPEAWWTEEEDRLPRAIAMAFGSDFVVEADRRHLHSTGVAGSPASAAALHALIDAETEERRRIRADVDAGARYDAFAGDVSYSTWLADRPIEEPPGR